MTMMLLLLLSFAMVAPMPRRRGPKIRSDAEVSAKTRRNRRWQVRRIAAQIHGSTPLKPRVLRVVHRRRAGASDEDVLQVLMARWESKATWKTFIQARSHQGVHLHRVRRMEETLCQDLPVKTTTRAAHLSLHHALPLFLHLIERDNVLRSESPVWSLVLFIDGNLPYSRNYTCSVMSLSIAQAKHPHQLLMQLPYVRWLGGKDHQNVATILAQSGTVSILQRVTTTTWLDKPVRLVLSPDWAMCCTLLNWGHPGAVEACWDCWMKKGDTQKLCKTPAPLRDFCGTQSACTPLLRLLQHRDDFVYDVLHCAALVIGETAFHAPWLWCKQRCPAKLQDLLRVFRAHTSYHPYFPPEGEKIGRKDWKINGVLAKQLAHSASFWTDVGAVLPNARKGLRLRIAQMSYLHPWAYYLQLLKQLVLQILSWNPQNVQQRNDMCHEWQTLYVALQLPAVRWTTQVHYFAAHYTTRLLRHGNLVGICSEGGEHLHQPHTTIISTRRSLPKNKCPVGLLCCMKHQALSLALWRQGAIKPEDAEEADEVALPPVA